MGVNASKLKCLYLPAQSGKTRKMEELIKHYKDIHECFGDGDINVVISANNILLVKQTESRVRNDLATESEEGANDAVIKAGVFSWTSGEKECNISPTDLAFRLLGEIEMVVLCANPIRLKYLDQMLRRLSACPLFTKKINVWIDEADKSIKLWSKHEALLSLPAIHQVTLVSATFGSVFAKYGTLSVLGFYKTHPECYRRLKDSVKVEENFVTASALEFVKHVMLKHRAKLVRPGMRAFIPGETKKASHDAIADFLHKELGFVVIIINGERKEILVPGEETIDLRAYLTVSSSEVPSEFNTQLAKLYTGNNWARFPMAITGFYCVERGVTFQCGPELDPAKGLHDGFLFDYGVIPPIACKAEAYQTMARLFGNVGHLPKYKPVEIYTSSAMLNKVEKQEEIAVNLARIVQEQGLSVVSKADLKAAANFQTEAAWDLHLGEFGTLKEANDFMHEHNGLGKTPKALEKEMEGGFYKSSTTGALAILHYDAVKREMEGWSKLSNLNPKAPKVTGRITVCYRDLADPRSTVFICRIAVRK
jgi:hypothetical protein